MKISLLISLTIYRFLNSQGNHFSWLQDLFYTLSNLLRFYVSADSSFLYVCPSVFLPPHTQPTLCFLTASISNISFGYFLVALLMADDQQNSLRSLYHGHHHQQHLMDNSNCCCGLQSSLDKGSRLLHQKFTIRLTLASSHYLLHTNAHTSVIIM